MVLTEEEFLNWKEDEVTKAFFKGLVLVREKMKEQMILGLYDNPEFVQGKASALLEIREMSYDEFMEAQRSD
jgi:hypothetical protein